MWLWVRNFFWAFLVCIFIDIAFHPTSTVLGVIFFALWIIGGKADQARRNRRELERQARDREQYFPNSPKVPEPTPEDRERMVEEYLDRQPWGREYRERMARERREQKAQG